MGRSREKRLAVNDAAGLVGTDLSADDGAVAACPTGSLLVKQVGFRVPVGQRRFDQQPIGAEIESSASED